MEPEEIQDILRKAKGSKLSAEQQQALDDWYSEFDQSQKELIIFKNQQHEERIYARLLARIYARLPQSPENEKPAALSFKPIAPPLISTALPLKKEIKLHQQYWFRIAAVLALLTICIPLYKYITKSSIFNSQQTAKLLSSKTEIGEMMEVTLADGSVITLNSSTKLSYPRNFNLNKREVYLEGEAFFKVTHNPKKPFIVHSGTLNTQVLGTSFNIKAYKGMDEIRINVATGKVGVSNSSKTLGLLLPNQQISYHQKSSTYQIDEKNVALANAWTQGKIILDGASFSELSIVIKNTYGYTLETHNPQIKLISFKSTFNSYDKIESVMRAISRIPDAKFRIKDKKITMY